MQAYEVFRFRASTITLLPYEGAQKVSATKYFVT